MQALATFALLLVLAGCFTGFGLRPHPADPPQPVRLRRRKSCLDTACGIIFLMVLASSVWLSSGPYVHLP